MKLSKPTTMMATWTMTTGTLSVASRRRIIRYTTPGNVKMYTRPHRAPENLQHSQWCYQGLCSRPRPRTYKNARPRPRTWDPRPRPRTLSSSQGQGPTKSKAKAKDLGPKAKAKDFVIKAKAKATALCPRGASRTRTSPRGHHWTQSITTAQ